MYWNFSSHLSKRIWVTLFLCVSIPFLLAAQHKKSQKKPTTPQYGTASFYSDKFNGRKTANGEIYNSKKLTAAHNTLALGTWIKVTNLSNKKSVVVKVNDRLHPKNPRLVDLSRAAAQKLGYINKGLTKVRVDVIGKNPPTVAVHK
jgi:rare lipoprotein A